MSPNAQYNVAHPGSLPVRIAHYQRRKIYQRFVQAMQPQAGDTLLDIGATSDRSYDHSNYLEAWYPNKSSVTAVGIDPGAQFLEQTYPGLNFVLADGRYLPFSDYSYDIVHSSAVLEHVGNRDQQARFLRECWRVARKGVFVTTPNRWYPVEFHTLLPLLHWLPPKAFRSVLLSLGKGFFACEENLNLLSRNNLGEVAKRAGIDRSRIESIPLFGIPSNLLLICKYPESERATDTRLSKLDHLEHPAAVGGS